MDLHRWHWRILRYSARFILRRYSTRAMRYRRSVSWRPWLGGLEPITCARQANAVLYGKDERFPVPGFKVLRKSDQDKATIIGAGITLHEALKAADQLKSTGTAVRVIDLYCVKPLDGKALAAEIAATGGRLVTVEDHWAEGGIGEAVLVDWHGGCRSFKIATARCQKHARFGQTGRTYRCLRHIGGIRCGRDKRDLLKQNAAALGSVELSRPLEAQTSSGGKNAGRSIIAPRLFGAARVLRGRRVLRRSLEVLSSGWKRGGSGSLQCPCSQNKTDFR